MAPFDAATILKETQRAVGDDLPLDAGLLRRLESLLALLNEARLSGSAAVSTRGQIGDVLTERLLLAKDFARYPEIEQEEISRPIFIIGFPRTGTTLLQSLLTEDPASQGLHWWQAVYPTPAPGIAGHELEYRKARAAAGLIEFVARQPNQMILHPYYDQGANTLIEDEQIMALDFQNAYPTYYHRVPVLVHGVSAADARGSYAFHKRFLQHQQWQMPKRRWVCKGTAHQFCLQALWEVYPDALCLWAHRDPAEYLASMCTMGASLYDAIVGGIDYRAYGNAMIDQIDAGLNQLLGDPLLDDERLIHVSYRVLVHNPVEMIKTIYGRWDLPFSDECAERMRNWLSDPANKSDRYGKLSYSLADFGTTHDVIRRRFSAYRERFQLS